MENETDARMDDIANLQTPALLLDHRRLVANTRRMRERMQRQGVALRPHVKTAKCAEVAALAAGPGGPITVSTLHEAEWFAAAGHRDILYAVGMIATRLPRVRALLEADVALGVVTDDLATARAIAAMPVGAEPLRVLIEVDCGGRRAGVLPGDDALLAIGEVLASAAGVRLAGVMTHAGHSYDCRGVDAIRAVAREERDGALTAAQRLRAAGLPCDTVSVGSTPTAVHAADLSGVTEMRPGVYVFFDLAQLGIGSCRRDDIALSVLASVIGHSRHTGQLLLDAGGLALSKDSSAGQALPGAGYGELCDVQTLAPLGLNIASLHQEHGLVPVADEAMFERLPVGARVRVLPSHACMTAAAYDHYEVLTGGSVTARWQRTGGW